MPLEFREVRTEVPVPLADRINTVGGVTSAIRVAERGFQDRNKCCEVREIDLAVFDVREDLRSGGAGEGTKSVAELGLRFGYRSIADTELSHEGTEAVTVSRIRFDFLEFFGGTSGGGSGDGSGDSEV